MVSMVIKLGMIGANKNNGHPYSFSSIINGYNKKKLISSGWGVIEEYLSKENKSKFGIKDLEVTHIWTQNLLLSKNISQTCYIKNICNDFTDMIGKVDGVIIARDDWKSHYRLSNKFLKKGIQVFIDKPLTLNKEELKFFTKYLKNGTLMSCSGLRFSTELRNLKDKNNLKDLKLIVATIHKDFEKYGIHLLEAIFSMGKKYTKPLKIIKIPGNKQHYYIKYKHNIDLYLNCLGNVDKTINLKLFSAKNNFDINLFDNFGAFKKTLEVFKQMIITKKCQINPIETINLINLMISGSKL